VNPNNRYSLEKLKNHSLFENSYSNHINFNISEDNYLQKIVNYIKFNGEYVDNYNISKEEEDLFDEFF
jgi:hypothetical protein